MSKSILSLENLHVQLGSQMILRDISFEVKPGEVVGIIGPNGCGKTTLLNAVSGFVPVDTGTISVNNVDVMDLPAYKRVALGVTRGFQHVGIFREMTVKDNLIMAIERAHNYPWWWMLFKKYREKTDKEIDVALSEVGMEAHKDVLAGVLSGGQLRLLELVRLKILKGNLLLIDEPTAGVAPVLKDSLARMIKSLSKDHGRTIVIVEHDLRFLFNIADRVIVLVDGQKYLEGSPEEVKQNKELQRIYFGE